MNIANKLTISRIILTFIFLFFLFSKGTLSQVMALIVFTLAAWTDFLDGFLAKKRNEISDFGKFMDPIADKVLVIAAFLAFVEMKLVPAWIVVIIVFREFSITGLRVLALAKGKVIEAEMAGKHKTVSQIVSIYIVLFFIVLKSFGTGSGGFWDENLEIWFKNAIFYTMIITAILTLVSGISCILRNKGFFISAKSK